MFAGEAALLNDDRVGRALDELFLADRASLTTALSLAAIGAYQVSVDELHNDSTSICLYGAYRDATGGPRGGATPPRPARGHNKDHRPDLLTELREESSQFGAVTVGWPFTVLGHARRECTPGSRLVDGAVGGVVGRDRRALRIQSAA